MFQQDRWYAVSFSFMLDDNYYTKVSFSNNYQINDAIWEFDSDDTGIPSLIMAIVDNAPGLVEPQ